MIDKRAVLECMLQKGIARIFLNATYSGVAVPTTLANTPALALNISYRFEPGDLTVDDFGVRSTLSFSGRPFGVEVPWNAVQAMMSPSTDEFIQFEIEPDGPTFKLASGARQPAPTPKFKLYLVPDEPGITKTFSEPKRGHLQIWKN